VADALLGRYDRNGDGSLSVSISGAAEIRVRDELIVKLDADRDQMLSGNELGKFTERDPDVELRFALGRPRLISESNETGEAQDDDPRSVFPVKTRSDGTGFDVDVGEAMLEFRSRNVNPAKSGRQSNFQAPFQAFDSDNNGYIEEDESKSNPFIESVFKSMDRDGDGKVFKKEFDAYFDRLNEAAATRLTLEVADGGRQLFEMLDSSGDGQLCSRELSEAPAILDSADANHDRLLSGNEIPRHIRLVLSRGDGAASTGNPVRVRLAGRQPTPQTDSSGPLWFRKMDRNHDGDVSLREFLGPLEDFDRIDANHDGLISANEAVAIEKN
jgi:Ca2+-binding EF-hand superfamily protein